MVRPVHTFLATLLALVLIAALAGAVSPPPGLVSWGEQSYRLDSGEATSFHVDFEQIPVRRWVLLVESDRTPSHLNVRRVADGSLVYDQRDEIRHEADVPWGDGESISAVLTAGRKGGVFSVSIWGPPRYSHLRSYGYEVNRALEAFARGDVGAARQHLLTAQRGGDKAFEAIAADTRLAAVSAAGVASVGSVPAGVRATRTGGRAQAPGWFVGCAGGGDGRVRLGEVERQLRCRRQHLGIVVRGDDASIDEAFHRWAQIYLPHYGWVPVDANRGDKPSPADQAPPTPPLAFTERCRTLPR